jgi:small subunit ribosomal protein S16
LKKKAQEKLAAKANPVVEEAPVAEAVSEPEAVATESEVPAVEATTEDVVVAETPEAEAAAE